MAQTPLPRLTFNDSCSDCGLREVELPEPLPAVGDDFDWLLRDYDGFRLFMLEELAARFPERRRWTPADMEVVIVETLAVVLDQLSDMLDRVQAEAFLESARRPESVRRLLAMIGYDAVALAREAANIPDAIPPAGESDAQQRARLTVFRPALQLFGDDYQSIIDSELTALQQTHLEEFIADPDKAAVAALDSVQHFLDSAPQFVARARNHALQRYWTLYPHAMDAARTAGPRTIHTQKRMVTVKDYAERLEDHPLVMAAHGFSRWTGAWTTICAAVIMTNNILLDEPLSPAAVGGAEAFAILTDAIDDFLEERDLEPPEWPANPTPRIVLRPYLDAYRMAGQEVFLQDAELVGISISLSVRVAANYFQSEVRRAVLNALGTGLGGFFAAGRLKFGQDLHASDLIETVMALDGVQSVCLNRFKRLGKRFPDQSDDGRIQLDGLEIAVCENDPLRPERGNLRIVMHGGQRG
jgi:hypothetical protein